MGLLGCPRRKALDLDGRSYGKKKRKKKGEWEQYRRVERRYNKGPKDWQNVLAIRNFRYCIAAVECAKRTPRPRSIEGEVACYLRSH